ncbi:MAG: MFS transporter [Actinobacteria bacterium]|nr:MFS transporter [Actinomycetota bacterium]MCL6105164.1 MFS transporter [Actinomycetota bacterium]
MNSEDNDLSNSDLERLDQGSSVGQRSTPQSLGIRRLWRRELDVYPEGKSRMLYLTITVIAAIDLYYLYFVPGTVVPLLLAHLHMTFFYYIIIIVLSNAVGAFTSLLAGFSDRFGRANVIVIGLALVAILQFVITTISGELSYLILICAIGFVEGIILVATPALIRDFSPQMGRATAMGSWTLGPVVGSLIATKIATETLPHLPPWQDQFLISVVVGIVVFIIALVGLRELSPSIRDQLMVSTHDRELVEARARGIDIEEATSKPWRQLMHWDLISSSFGISIFLLIYYSAVAGFFTVYFTTTFHHGLTYLTTAQANGINTWFWAFDAAAVIVFGLLSDAVKVRKPFTLVGAVGGAVMVFIFALKTHQPTTSYYTLVIIVSLLGIFLGMTFAPWLAAFSENVERYNTALVATGLSIWGWMLRAVVAVSTLVLAYVVTSATTVVDNQRYASFIPMVEKLNPLIAKLKLHPHFSAQLIKYPCGTLPPRNILYQAIHDFGQSGVTKLVQYCTQLHELNRVQSHLLVLQAAVNKSPTQWQHWWWVCLGGAILFIPFVFILKGRWKPSSARKDIQEYEHKVDEELAKLGK